MYNYFMRKHEMSNSPFDAASRPKNYRFFFRVVVVSTWPVLVAVSLFFIKTDIILLMYKLLKSEAMHAHCAIVSKSFETLRRLLI